MIKRLMKRYALSRSGAKDLIVATVALTIRDLVMMLPVGLMYYLVSDLINGSIPTDYIWLFAVGCIVCMVLIFLSSYWTYNASYFATYKESSIRRVGLAEKLRKLPLAFFGKKDLSDLTTTLMGDCATLETSFSHWVPAFFASMISTSLIAISLFAFDWRMALASMWVIPSSIIIVAFSKKAQNSFKRKLVNVQTSCIDGIQECIETSRDLKSNNAEEKYLSVLKNKIANVERKMIYNELGSAMFVISAGLLLKFGIATVAIVGGILLVDGSLSLLTFFMFLLVASRLYDPMNSSLMNLAAINSTEINVARMNEINDYQVQSGTDDFKSNGYNIEFTNVSFAYNSDETVLKDVSFVAEQGKVTALIGPSGGGKSTVSKLAARFWDTDKGSIKIGGTDVKTVDPEKLLSAYSIVFQDVTLFNNTVMENIRIGKSDATDEEVMKAAEDAQCNDFIAKLPNGYNSMIGENGSSLSGGERQRISIARALLKNAPIILLDEATASLDAENETEVQEAISRLVKNKTVMIIAHRMRTVADADRIVVLDGGVVAEQGSPQELEKKKGFYARMLKLQNND